MRPNYRIFALTALLTLSSLFGCASTPPCKREPLQVSESVLEPAPPPEAFSKCLREILAIGRGELAQTSAECSKLLQAQPTE